MLIICKTKEQEINMVSIGPNGFEFTSSISSHTCTPSNSPIDITVTSKRFSIELDSSLSSGQTVQINVSASSTILQASDIIVKQVTSDSPNLSVSVYNIGSGSCTVKMTATGAVYANASATFLVLT